MSTETEVVVNPLKGALDDYWARIKSGDIGALPAVLGLLVLCLISGPLLLRYRQIFRW